VQCSIELEFADGEYEFRLPLPRIDELQRKTGIGIGKLFGRVLKGCVQSGLDVVLVPADAEFYALDLIETIRQGLIGGGRGAVNGEEVKVTPALANKLVENYVLDRPLSESWNLAASILMACIVGYEPPKKGQPAEQPATQTQTES
jgi:hypothetical protein